MKPPRNRLIAAVFCAALAAACGGGGGGGDDPPLPTFDTRTVRRADPGSTLPDGWQHGVFMEIFVRAYKDSDGDGTGDLRGLISKLDYLEELGISGIWLMPVTPSQDGDHGYAVENYRAIEPDYGTLADFDALLAAAHARGIGVIVDHVLNHSAYRHAAFTNSRAARGNTFRDWYVWRDSAPSGWTGYDGNPWRTSPTGAYYAVFWDQMPDLNLRNAEVVDWQKSHLRFWLNRGVDGFRFDAVGNLFENGSDAWLDQPENLTLLAGLRTLLDGYQRRFMVCEGPNAPLPYASACGSAFAFGHQVDVIDAARGNAAAVQRVAAYFDAAGGGVSTMLSNHDSFAGRRPWDQLAGNVARLKLAAATYLLQPGTPFVYYGEEVGMAGAASLSGDPQLRTPMSWTGDADGFTSGAPFRSLSANVATNNVAAQRADPNSLLSFYKAMIALRNAHPSIARGSYAQSQATGTALSFQRRLGSETTLVAINYGTSAATLSLDGLPPSTTLARRWPAGAAALTSDAAGRASISVPALSLAVYTTP